MTETLAHWYSSESTRQELSNEYQHYRFSIVFKIPCVIVFWMKVASAFEEIRENMGWAIYVPGSEISGL